ncbi:ArsA family ATPase [Bacillus dakarensis]|uniref:ArsA family ATPase n=1 Tax=Robertmurraya dakarensis TaxID=1926278 RepID=UPI0009814B9E|nr:ArsA family ATPase [Bacillus dakarensis]
MEGFNKKLYFVGGKGGVGKSTTSAALAYNLSRIKKKVLLVSTDPAHNTGDLFHVKLEGKVTNIKDHLDVLEIDSKQESNRYIETVKENIKGFVKSTMIQEAFRQIDLASTTPGAEEAALFDRMSSIIMEEIHHYDAIIFDTAPTGHTIRLLTLPQLMGVWMDGLLERRRAVNEKNYNRWMDDGEKVEDPIYEVLQSRKRKFNKVREILLDRNQSEYLFVLNAERLPILETRKAMDTLKQHGIAVNTILINKLIPEEADGIFLQKRKETESHYLGEIQTVFAKEKKVLVPLLSSDISTFHDLSLFADLLKEGFSKSEENEMMK